MGFRHGSQSHPRGEKVMEQKKRNYKVLNMCDFCANTFPACQAKTITSQSMAIDKGNLGSGEAVIACDKYRNPVASLLEVC